MLWNAVIFGPGMYGLVYPECLILESSPSTLFLAHDADPFLSHLSTGRRHSITPPPPLTHDNGTFVVAIARNFKYQSRHTVRGWNVQALFDFRRDVPEQTTDCQVHFKDVPPQCLCQRRTLLRHIAKSVEPNVRRCRHFDQYPEPVA